MKIAYFDCFAGCGGDMIVAALIDAGVNQQAIVENINSLKIQGLELNISQTQRSGITAKSFEPVAPHQHHHRRLPDITNMIENSGLSERAKNTAIEIFRKLAVAEAKIHDKELNEIHFHEVGAVDSIADICSAAVGIEMLEVDKIYCSPLSLGSGVVKAAHGMLPVPAPATAEILKGLPVQGGPGTFEQLTPTAAAILATVVDEFAPLPQMRIEKIGYGAGNKNPDDFPNLLRIFVGTAVETDDCDTDCVCEMEANIDDSSAEMLGHIAGQALQIGALDVFTSPIYMKNNRPATLLKIICRPGDSPKIQNLLFEQGLTLGIRKTIRQRATLKRQISEIETEYGKVRIKRAWYNGKIVRQKPEFADCSKLSQANHVPISKIFQAVSRVVVSENKDFGDVQ